MQDVHLPRHLLMPFFHLKPIQFRLNPNSEYSEGILDLTVFGDGLCHIQILFVSNRLGVVHNETLPLTAYLLDKVLWDAERRQFVGDFV